MKEKKIDLKQVFDNPKNTYPDTLKIDEDNFMKIMTEIEIEIKDKRRCDVMAELRIDKKTFMRAIEEELHGRRDLDFTTSLVAYMFKLNKRKKVTMKEFCKLLYLVAEFTDEVLTPAMKIYDEIWQTVWQRLNEKEEKPSYIL